MLMFAEVASTRHTRGVMALSTTYKHPKGKMHDPKCFFFQKITMSLFRATFGNDIEV